MLTYANEHPTIVHISCIIQYPLYSPAHACPITVLTHFDMFNYYHFGGYIRIELRVPGRPPTLPIPSGIIQKDNGRI